MNITPSYPSAFLCNTEVSSAANADCSILNSPIFLGTKEPCKSHTAMEVLTGESRRIPLTFHQNFLLAIADKFDLFSGYQ